MYTSTFAKILAEEFEKRNWGDIDPWLFKAVAGGDLDQEDANYEDAVGMREILENVLRRMDLFTDRDPPKLPDELS